MTEEVDASPFETAGPEPFDFRSETLIEDRTAELRRVFPEAITEGGRIDFDKLKLALGEAVDVGKERYGLTWPGKADCFKTIQAPSMGTLRPCPEESVNWDSTENLIIEGDNLEVLKLLQKSYLGKVKMIYIDPPYNTGNDFIYPDNYTESLQTYLEYTGQVDAEGKKFSTNTDTAGRFHSKWLNMMYPRLYLARNLLRDDGVIFISIDDAEQQNLRRVCDEVFGESNFIDTIVWKKRYGGGAKEKYLVSIHEYVLAYARSLDDLGELHIPLSQASIERYYTMEDEHSGVRGPYRTHPLEATKSMEDRPNLVFPIEAPDGTEVWPKRQWLWSRERAEEARKRGELSFLRDRDGAWTVHTKQFLRDEDGEIRQAKTFSIIDDVYTQHGTNELISLFGDARVFPFPKPTGLLAKLVDLGDSEGDSVILDLFAGSGAMGHTVLDLNTEDGGNRKFILVQLPEPTGREDYPTITDITKERVRRVIMKLDEADEGALPLEGTTPQDRGFRVFKLDESNFTTWGAQGAERAEDLTKQLELHVDHLREGRSEEDLLFELLLKSGFTLETPAKELALGDEKVYSVADGLLVVCLARTITQELIDQIAGLDPRPGRVVCLDEGFGGNDQLKVNANETFKTKGVESFRTV